MDEAPKNKGPETPQSGWDFADDATPEQEITHEYEQTMEAGNELVEKIKKEHGYGVTSIILKENRLSNENKKITKKALEEIRETIVDLKTLLTIIEVKKKLINSKSTFTGGLDMNNLSFSEGNYDITFVKSSKHIWDIESAYQFSLATEEFRKYLQNKHTEHSKKVKTQPMKAIQVK